jgi:hypothetical protein
MSRQSKKDDKFYQKWEWPVWFSSHDVQRLKAAAKCLWFEMIGLMWGSEERGYLVNNGKPLSIDQLYQTVHGFDTREEFDTALEAIESEGLFSVRETDGAIYSRKILSDLEKSAKYAKSGRKGGLKSLGGSSNRSRVGSSSGSSNSSSEPIRLTPDEKQAFREALAEAKRLEVEEVENVNS